jgi:hypothetical protein
MPIIKKVTSDSLIKEYTDIENIVEVTPIPIIDFPDEVNESSTTIGTITNYQEGSFYTISSNNGSIAYTEGATFEYNAPSVSSDVEDIISVQCTIFNQVPSPILNHSVTILDVIGNTPTPTLSFPDEVSRNSITQGTITNHTPGETYTITTDPGMGTISNIVGNTFDYTAPDNQTGGNLTDHINIQGFINGMNPSSILVHDVTVLNSDDITTTPQLDFPVSVVRNSITTCTITNHTPGTVYTILVSQGTISNIVGGTFDYTAPDAMENTPDTLYVSGTAPGKIESLYAEHPFTIMALFIFDDSAINNDFENNEESNNGFIY